MVNLDWVFTLFKSHLYSFSDAIFLWALFAAFIGFLFYLFVR